MKTSQAKKLKVPYSKQFNDNACGAAVLQMVYNYYGLMDISQEEIFDKYNKINPDSRNNSFIETDDLIDDAKSRGFSGAYWGQLDYLKREETVEALNNFIEEGLPIIVCQQFTTHNPVGHFRVVIGFGGNKICLHDPNEKFGGKHRTWSTKKFMEFWQPSGTNVVGGIFVIIKK